MPKSKRPCHRLCLTVTRKDEHWIASPLPVRGRPEIWMERWLRANRLPMLVGGMFVKLLIDNPQGPAPVGQSHFIVYDGWRVALTTLKP